MTKIYLTLLSTTCVKIHQITYVIFETISYFSRHNSSLFFQLKHYILSIKVAPQIFRLSTTQVKVYQISHVIFRTKSQFFFNRTQRQKYICITNWGKLVLQIVAALFYYKLGQMLLQIGVASLLEISLVTKWGSYYK